MLLATEGVEGTRQLTFHLQINSLNNASGKHKTKDAKEREESSYTVRSSIYRNFQPLSVARTAKSMSSTVV